MGALSLTLTALRKDVGMGRAFGGWIVVGAASAIVVWRARDASTPFLLLAPLLFAVQASVVGPLDDLRHLVMMSVALAVVESAIVAAVSLVFGAFSTPFLTAALTVGVVLIGRNADLLAKLPERTFGHAIALFGRGIARIVPNLQMFVPPRVVLTGHAGGSSGGYVGEAFVYGFAYVVVLLVISALIFRQRDFA
jgi:hypothetical protein